MDFPLDPTTTDASAESVLRAVADPELLAAACRAIGVDADGSRDRDHLIAGLSPVDRELLVEQVRYAAPPSTHYRRLPGLERLAPEALDDLVDDPPYGTQLRAVDESVGEPVGEPVDALHLVCSVPDGGAQSQLSVSEANRHTTVATVAPGSDLLSIRAPSPELADATAGALAGVGPVGAATRLDFRDPDLLASLESDLLRGYHRLTLGVRQQTARTDRIELASDDPDAATDLREDGVVRTLLDRSDTRRRSGRAVLDPTASSPGADPVFPSPTVDIDFAESVVRYRTPAPESTRVAVDRAVRSLSERLE